MIRTAVIVQARWGSQRLTGKVLADICGQTLLSHVLQRCRQIRSVDAVVCAVPNRSGPDDEVAAEAARADCVVVRGDEHNVLDRYLNAARAVDADLIMRITSDNPLVDPDVCDQLTEFFRAQTVDYASNNLTRSWPLGIDCELFTREALERSALIAAAPYDLEHVTPTLRRDPAFRRAHLACPFDGVANVRLTVDYPEDLAFIRALAAHSARPLLLLRLPDILDILAQHPEL